MKLTPDLSAHCDSGGVSVHNKPCEGFACRRLWVLCCPGQNKVPVSMSAICDPHFLAIENIIIPFFDGSGLDPCYIWSRPWFCHTVCLSKESIDTSTLIKCMCYLIIYSTGILVNSNKNNQLKKCVDDNLFNLYTAGS